MPRPLFVSAVLTAALVLPTPSIAAELGPEPSPEQTAPSTVVAPEPDAPEPAVDAAVAEPAVGPAVAEPAVGPAAVDPAVAETYLVQIAPGSGDTVTDALAAIGVTPAEAFEQALDGFAVDLTADQLAAVDTLPGVAEISPENTFAIAETQDNPPWNLDRTDQRSWFLDGAFISRPGAGTGVRVYVVDTGISAHSTFADRLAPGYSAFDDVQLDADCNGHGTHVAGTVASTRYGVAKAATLVPVRVLDCAGSGTTSGVIGGLDWVLANHPAGSPGVVVMSLGGPHDVALNAAVAEVSGAGLVVVAAAGNGATDACTVSPASAPEALTTGATRPDDVRASFSNWGPCLDLFAPGVYIRSASNTDPYGSTWMSGTSMAAPHVAGIAATYLGEHPGATVADVTAAVSAAAVGVADPGMAGTTTALATSLLFPTPDAPGDVTVTAAGVTSLNLAWTAPATGTVPTAYTVLTYTADGFPVRRTTTTQTSTTVAWLAPDTSYRLTVAADGPDGGGPEVPLDARTAPAPSAPAGPTASDVTPSSVTLTWTPPATSAEFVTAYQVQASSGGSWSTVDWVTAPTLSTTLDRLSADTGYAFQVRAWAGYAPGAWSGATAVRTLRAPTAPAQVAATAAGTRSVTVTWSPPEVVHGTVQEYVVQRSRDGVSWSTAARVPGDDRAATVTGLAPATAYHVRVTARTAAGEGPWSRSVGVTTATATQGFVMAVYRDLFRRAPDPQGLSGWTRALDGGVPRRAVADAITSSTEYRSRLITASYSRYLGRSPDSGGLSNWLAAMSSGMTIQQMEAGFVASAEFYARAGGTSAAWVRLLYRTVLLREPSAAEVAWWVGALNHGASRNQVALGFVMSEEYLAGVVDGHYQNLLGRRIDPAGRASWVRAIQTGSRLEQVVGSIVASTEYWNRNV